MKRLVVALLLCASYLAPASLPAQIFNPAPVKRVPMDWSSSYLRAGLEVTLLPMTQFCKDWGIRFDALESAGREGAEGAGWTVHKSANTIISVSVTPLTQREEDLYAFRLEVHGGVQADQNAGVEDAPADVGDISARRTIDVPKGDDGLLVTSVRTMVSSVAEKLKRELYRREMHLP